MIKLFRSYKMKNLLIDSKEYVCGLIKSLKEKIFINCQNPNIIEEVLSLKIQTYLNCNL